MNFDIDMSELSDLAITFAVQAPKQAMASVKKATVAEGRKVKSRAVAGAPRDRPWLANHIRMKTWKNPDSIVVNVFAEGVDERGRPVAVFVEHGTAETAPQPFMVPAAMPAESSFPPAVLAAVDPFGPGVNEGPDA